MCVLNGSKVIAAKTAGLFKGSDENLWISWQLSNGVKKSEFTINKSLGRNICII